MNPCRPSAKHCMNNGTCHVLESVQGVKPSCTCQLGMCIFYFYEAYLFILILLLATPIIKLCYWHWNGCSYTEFVYDNIFYSFHTFIIHFIWNSHYCLTLSILNFALIFFLVFFKFIFILMIWLNRY